VGVREVIRDLTQVLLSSRRLFYEDSPLRLWHPIPRGSSHISLGKEEAFRFHAVETPCPTLDPEAQHLTASWSVALSAGGAR
jgi:hypothetical protein